MTLKTRKPTFKEVNGVWVAGIYSETLTGWVGVKIALIDGLWVVSYDQPDCKDELHKCRDIQDAFDWVCAYHRQSVKNTFIYG